MKDMIILLIVFIVLVIVFFMLSIFYKGGKRKIHIVKKYINNKQETDKKNKTGKYVIEGRYGESDKIHVLSCEKEIYDKLRMGRDYNIKIKKSCICKLYEKNKDIKGKALSE